MLKRQDNCLPRTLYVHVGPSKTGTSAIQHTLREHDNSTVVYPKVGLSQDGSHRVLVSTFFGRSHHGDGPQNECNKMFEKIGAATQGTGRRNILISSEGLAKGDGCGAFIRALLPYLNEEPVNVEILLACREHFSRAASLFSQLLMHGEQRDPDQFLRERISLICYEPLVKKLRETGFNVTALAYHPSRDWVERFLIHVGFPKSRIPDIETRRLSFSPKALIASLAANNVVKSREEKRRYRRAIVGMNDSLSPSQFIFGREAAAAADPYFSADKQFLLDECGICLPEPNWEAQKNVFFLETCELAEIAAAVRNLGDGSAQIIDFAARFLRHSPIQRY